MATITVKQLAYATALTALATLATPFVWLKVGLNGHNQYGASVPDVYILGATILGKDRNFWGISFAYKIQLAVILFFAASSFLIGSIHTQYKRTSLVFTSTNFLLLFLFPIWLCLYTDGVISNSDDVQLNIYPHVGLLLYALLIRLIVLTMRKLTVTVTIK